MTKEEYLIFTELYQKHGDILTCNLSFEELPPHIKEVKNKNEVNPIIFKGE